MSDSAPSERWVVGFFYRLTTIGIVVLSVIAMVGWFVAVAIGILVAWNSAWGTNERVVTIVAIIATVVGFSMLEKWIGLQWNESDWVERTWWFAVAPAIGIWFAWYLDWGRVAGDLEQLVSAWSVEWETVQRGALGVGVAIALIVIGRVALWVVMYFWRLVFWLVTGERFDGRRMLERLRT